MQWCTQLLVQHGTLLKKQSVPLMASIKNLQRSISQKQIDLSRMYVRYVTFKTNELLCFLKNMHEKVSSLYSLEKIAISCSSI